MKRPVFGALIAIAITTTMDAVGLSAFSALPLFPLTSILWYIERLSRRSMGLVRGQWRYYGLGMLHPLVVLGAVAIISIATNAADISHASWKKASLNLAIVTISTILVVIVTEEGFFRGWLWASLEKAGKRQPTILIWSSIAFSLWHLSWVTLTTDKLPAAQLPVFVLNAAVMGAIWGLLRGISGSVIVASVTHGLWNGIDYVFFGFGAKVGALGIKNTAFYGPEVGVLGLILNTVFVVALWRCWKARAGDQAGTNDRHVAVRALSRFPRGGL